MSHKFEAILEIIVGNPFVFIPEEILLDLFQIAESNTRPIPVKGSINGKDYQQTLVKYSGAWRLYINMNMLKDSPRRIGELIHVEIEFDPSDRSIEAHPKLVQALEASPEARKIFEGLSPSRKKEIVRYIHHLKSEESVDRNVRRAINFLLGRERFVGREKP